MSVYRRPLGCHLGCTGDSADSVHGSPPRACGWLPDSPYERCVGAPWPVVAACLGVCGDSCRACCGRLCPGGGVAHPAGRRAVGPCEPRDVALLLRHLRNARLGFRSKSIEQQRFGDDRARWNHHHFSGDRDTRHLVHDHPDRSPRAGRLRIAQRPASEGGTPSSPAGKREPGWCSAIADR